MRQRRLITITLSSVMFLLSGCSHLNMNVTTAYTGKEVTEGQTADQLYEIGRTLFSQEKQMAALKYFKASYNIDPKSLKTLNGLAGVYDKIKRFDLSKDYYYRALLINPRSVSTLNNLGYSYLLQNDVELAIYYFRHAEAAGPGNSKVQNNLAWAENEYERKMLARGADIFSPQDVERNSTEHRALAQVKSLETITVEEKYSEKIGAIELPAPPKRSVGYQLSMKKAEPAPVILQEKTKRSEAQKIVPDSTETKVLVSRSRGDVRINSKNPVIEFSNGAGRRSLAARLRKFAKKNNVEVQRLTNADHYSHMKSTIYYKAGWKGEANELSKLFPINISVAEVTNQIASLRLEIGGDLLEFDRSLINEMKQE